MKKYIVSIKKALGEYTSLIIEASNRLAAYNQVAKKRIGTVLSIKEI